MGVRKRQARMRLATLDGLRVSRAYKSGRSFSRGTPETRSTSKIRSTGTFPDFFHFWTAWYETEHLRAVSCRPPQAVMTLVTTQLSSVSLMDGNIQPIVAIGQQRHVANPKARISDMPVRNKEEAREAFGDALHRFLDGIKECPADRGRIAWVHQALKRHTRGQNVSYESVRKWLKGIEIPDQANQVILFDAIKAKRSDLFPEEAQPKNKLENLLGQLSSEDEQQVVGFIHGLLASKTKRAQGG